MTPGSIQISREKADCPPSPAILAMLLDADPDERQVAGYLADGELHVARREGIPVGVIVIRPAAPDTWEIMNCAVAPHYRRQGYGTALVRHALAVIASKGMRYAELGTSDASPGPMALYRSCGFRVTGRIKNHFLDNYPGPVRDNGVPCIDMIRMRAELPAAGQKE